MRHIVTSNWFMDWQKYPKSRTSIRIRQAETLDSIKCHTFPGMGGRTLVPGMGGRTLDILLHALNSSHLNSFIVLCNGVESGFMACACTSLPVWLGATELTNLQVNLTPGPGLRLRLFWAYCFGKACFATDLGFKEINVDTRAGYVMAARGAGGAAGPAPRHQPGPSESEKAIYIYCDYCIICKYAGSVVVKAAGCYAHDCRFVPSSLHFFFLYFLFMAKWNCTCHVCTWHKHGLNMYAHKHTYKYLYIRVYTRLNIVLYIRVCTWYTHGIDLAVRMIYMSVHVS
jgi:hypothetical protein